MLKLVFILVLAIFANKSNAWFDPNWESLDSREIPSWYDEAKFGVTVTWGVYSVPSFAIENEAAEWFLDYYKHNYSSYIEFMENNYPGFEYEDLASLFTAELFKPEEWVDLFKKSGAKYVVLTIKQFDGFCMWSGSPYSGNFDVDLGPHKNLLEELVNAVRSNSSLKFGVEYSLVEYFNPLYEMDKKNNFTTTTFIDEKIQGQMMEFVVRYSPDILYTFSGNTFANSDYFKSTEFLSWLFNKSPAKNVVINDHWGHDAICKHGGVSTCSNKKWKYMVSIDKKSRGFNRNTKLEGLETTESLLREMANVVSNGGNFEINVGATKDGRIPLIFQERLIEIGKWLEVNGEAIYGTSEWESSTDNKGTTFYTMKGSTVYALNHGWPKNNKLSLAKATHLFYSSDTKATILGGNGSTLHWTIEDQIITLDFPEMTTVNSNWFYVVKIEIGSLI